ncbi:MAG: hypothetical protein SFV32_12655 [Opitutaceae bacterium]|nr:hypothetical protein [Opitutaceae bacterium]
MNTTNSSTPQIVDPRYTVGVMPLVGGILDPRALRRRSMAQARRRAESRAIIHNNYLASLKAR